MNSTSTSYSTLREYKKFVRAEQIRLIYRQTAPAIAGNPLGGALLIYIFRNVVDNGILFTWLAFLILVSAIRVILSIAFSRRELDEVTILPWGQIYNLLTFLHGSVWAIAWIIFIPVEEPVYLVVVATWMVGLSAAAVSAYSVSLSSLVAYFVPVVLPGTVHLFVVGGSLATALGLAVILYSVVVLRAVLPINKLMLDAIRLNFNLKDEIHKRKKVEAKLREISLKDELTGLSNRRHFDNYLDTELKRAKRTLNPLSLILMDVDFFKAFNDSYGHPGGDACLQRIGRVIDTAVKRTSDLAFRYGGEELALILPNTNSDSAYMIAESIRKDVQALEIPHNGSKLSELNLVTISSGVATIISGKNTVASAIIQQADDALYQAKDDGRNQVVVFVD